MLRAKSAPVVQCIHPYLRSVCMSSLYACAAGSRCRACASCALACVITKRGTGWSYPCRKDAAAREWRSPSNLRPPYSPDAERMRGLSCAPTCVKHALWQSAVRCVCALVLSWRIGHIYCTASVDGSGAHWPTASQSLGRSCVTAPAPASRLISRFPASAS